MPDRSASPARRKAAPSSRLPATRQPHAVDKNQPLMDDIRLLGRILGEVIREQEGREAFELVERVRQLSVAFRLKRDAQAGKTFDKLLKSLSGEDIAKSVAMNAPAPLPTKWKRSTRSFSKTFCRSLIPVEE